MAQGPMVPCPVYSGVAPVSLLPLPTVLEYTTYVGLRMVTSLSTVLEYTTYVGLRMEMSLPTVLEYTTYVGLRMSDVSVLEYRSTLRMLVYAW